MVRPWSVVAIREKREVLWALKHGVHKTLGATGVQDFFRRFCVELTTNNPPVDAVVIADLFTAMENNACAPRRSMCSPSAPTYCGSRSTSKRPASTSLRTVLWVRSLASVGASFVAVSNYRLHRELGTQAAPAIERTSLQPGCLSLAVASFVQALTFVAQNYCASLLRNNIIAQTNHVPCERGRPSRCYHRANRLVGPEPDVCGSLLRRCVDLQAARRAP